MMPFKKIPTLDTYEDWLEKAEYELNRYKTTSSVYDMANCFLSLNILPEWISKSDNVSKKLMILADEKIQIMKFTELDIQKVKEYELDQLLRLVRLFCNHAKHNEKKDGFKKIRMYDTFPISFPMKFEYLTIGNNEEDGIKTVKLLETIIEFWVAHQLD